MKIETYTLPSHWASYLMNNDPSGLEQSEISVCDGWMEYHGLSAPLSVSEEPQSGGVMTLISKKKGTTSEAVRSRCYSGNAGVRSVVKAKAGYKTKEY